MDLSTKNKCTVFSQGLKYINIDFSNKTTPHQYCNGTNDYLPIISDGRYTGRPGGANFGAHLNSQGYVRHSGMGNTTVDSCNTEATLISSNGQEESVALSNNSEQPLWRSNIGTDYKGPARPVNTSDLVCWAFQVCSFLVKIFNGNNLKKLFSGRKRNGLFGFQKSPPRWFSCP